MGISWDFMAIFMGTVVLKRCIVNSCAEVYSQGILTLLKLSRGDLVGGLCPIDDFSRSFIWINYNDLTATSLENMVSKGNHPKMALIQVSEIL